jgi:hypothetical protein
MRAKILTLASATGFGFLTLVGFQSSAQAHEGYRHQSFRVEHRDHDRGYVFHFHRDRDRDGDRR